MTYSAVPVDREEMPAWSQMASRAFGYSVPAARSVLMQSWHVPEEFWWIEVEGGTRIGAFRIRAMELTVAPGRRVPVLCLSSVGVELVHRRRGALTFVLQECEQRARETRCSAVALMSDQGWIYGRFGFGMATRTASWSIRPGAMFSAHRNQDIERLPPDKEETRELLHALFKDVSLLRVGELTRDTGYWNRDIFAQSLEEAHEAPVVLGSFSGGRLEGFALIRYEGTRPWRIQVRDLQFRSRDACLSLLGFLLGIDDIAEVRADLPTMSALPWELRDPRVMSVTGVSDALWLRLLDVRSFMNAIELSVDELGAVPGWLNKRASPRASWRAEIQEQSKREETLQFGRTLPHLLLNQATLSTADEHWHLDGGPWTSTHI